MGKKVAPILIDMIEAGNGVRAATAGMSLDEFRKNWVVRHAVQRALEIISEASRRLPDDVTALRPEIPWPKVRAIGNLLRHEYHAVDDEVVWRIVQDDLPTLHEALVALHASIKV